MLSYELDSVRGDQLDARVFWGDIVDNDSACLQIACLNVDSLCQLSNLVVEVLVLVEREVEQASVLDCQRRADLIDLQSGLWAWSEGGLLEAGLEPNNGITICILLLADLVDDVALVGRHESLACELHILEAKVIRDQDLHEDFTLQWQRKQSHR